MVVFLKMRYTKGFTGQIAQLMAQFALKYSRKAKLKSGNMWNKIGKMLKNVKAGWW